MLAPQDNVEDQQGIYHVDPADPLAGSAAAAQAMMELFTGRQSTATPGAVTGAAGPARIGVFICQCNGQISNVVDTAILESECASRQGVAHVQVIAQACSPEAADSIYQAVLDHNLNRAVLAACSCCSVDQVCYSCTYQRVRCKEHLLGRHFDRANPLFEFVNIREHCAWVHEGDPQAATAAATAMVAASIAKIRLSVVRPEPSSSLEKTVLILGTGPAATTCQEALLAQQMQALRLETLPAEVRQTASHFTVFHNGASLGKGSALVLAPCDELERDRINQAFDTLGRQPRTQILWGQAETHRPGVFVCEPGIDPVVAGMAAAARAAAWLHREHTWPEPTPAEVEPDRCRGCGDCEKICEFGAIQLQGEGENLIAWIDPAICQGCGICAARCPAGAIVTGGPTPAQMEAMLEAILA
jgi:heterodisulfide reductase subunit A-like polyferredoxin